MHNLQPEDAQRLLMTGKARLIDIRGRDEFAYEHIQGAINLPAEEITPNSLGSGTVIFTCRSGARTDFNRSQLAAACNGESMILAGGLMAWRKAGLPVEAAPRQPLPLQRQVQLTVGSLLLVFTLLSLTVSPWFVLGAGMMGAGLTVAGLTGFCGLARVLKVMPWNKASQSKASPQIKQVA